MNMFEMMVMLVFVVPIIGLCIGFVLCAGMMQMHEEETAQALAGERIHRELEDQQAVNRYRAYAASVSNRRYVRPAGAMIRAAH